MVHIDIKTVRDLIDRWAEAQPDRVFLISPETARVLTFAQLQDQARRLCGWFCRMGLQRGDKISFLMDNGLFTAQVLLGTMYGGFVTVPLNPRAGVTQLVYTLENCDAKIVVVGRQYDALINDVLAHVRRSVAVVSADSDTGLTESEAPAIMPVGLLSADDMALLIYTSGSTGQPKGAIHTHGSVLARAWNSVQQQGLTAEDRSLLVLPLYHANAESVTLVPTLMSGGSVVLPQGFLIGEFWNWLHDHRCSWSALVPTIVSQLLDWKDEKAESRASAPGRIRFLRSSSGALSPSLNQAFIDKFGLPLLQGMGSSETGNVFLNPVPPGKNKIGSLGLPIGLEMRIVDRAGGDLPAGEPGEILLRGDAVMRGYYKDPAATAAALDSAGWLHTGDLAYRDEDGYVFMIGRSKELIIKGGVNIAPKQIDEILEAHPAILEAAAVGVPDRHVGEDVVAFAVLRDGMGCDERELLSFCERRLGYFKTPTRIHFVADLPKGPSGKVQRLRLTERAESLATPMRTVMSAGKQGSDEVLALEQIIAEIWGDLLAQTQIGPDSNFFALGGQSLQAIQCLARIRERLPVLLSLSDFFENATVARLAALVRRHLRDIAAPENARGVNACTDLQPIPKRGSTQPYQLSPAQERIWFMEQFNTGEPLYNEAEAVRLQGPVDLAVLEQAFNVIVQRHETLRTTVAARDGTPRVVIHEQRPLTFKKISLRHLADGTREAELAQLLVAEPRLPFQLEAEQAVRVTIVEIDHEDHAFILMMHHMFCDRASFGLLWRELATLYDAALRGQPSALAPLPIQYGDYAAWLRQPFQQARSDEDLAFWREQLRGAPTVLDQPTDRPRPSVMSFRGDKRQFEFDATLAKALRQLCREQKTSLFTVFAAALSAVMHRYTGQDDLLIGIPIADRERPELQPLIGLLVDVHVLRTDLSGAPTFRALLSRVQKGLVGVYSHRAAPFDRVVAAVQPERSPSYAPVFQVVLNWRDRDSQAQFIGLPGLACEPLLAQSKTAKFDLTLVLTDDGNEIGLEAEYSTDLFDESRIERLAGHLRMLLEGAATNAEQSLAELPLLTSVERQELLFGWGMNQADEEIYS
jgi:acyl-CoA synthetase (AMP-forming)/AMP-acid ligase II/acyl carrier protein